MRGPRYLGVILFCVFHFVNGQVEVCMFYNLHADCYYRVDSVCLSHITGEINQCAEPIEVTFTITCKQPRVDFEFVFSSNDQTVSVPGFKEKVEMNVKLKMKDDDTLNVEVDFYVYGRPKTDFINSDVKLGGLTDSCPLNKAAQIAIGIMGALVVVAGIMILVILYVRYRRRRKLAQNSNELIENTGDTGLSTPRASTVRPEDTEEDYLENTNATISEQSAETNPSSINRHDISFSSAKRSDKTNAVSINGSTCQQLYNSAGSPLAGIQNASTSEATRDIDSVRTYHSGRVAGLHSTSGVKYSDIMKNYQSQLKVSDC